MYASSLLLDSGPCAACTEGSTPDSTSEKNSLSTSRKAPKGGPHDGVLLTRSPPAYHAGPTSGFAVVALVLGIMGFSPLAVIFGHIALHNIDKKHSGERGRGMAIAGLVLGWIGVAGLVLALVFMIAVLATVGPSGA
ncbi:DUF4190 domain-containing protein [Actinopolyspora mortivallis]|uniref:DUF4190 domain-containing protein n=1 Tax=Actinopolyspora mortivallis TaxID=33906 RepID=UPI00248125F1|nr:DUF4190 domain-containing protein [Actinopolyspora mortivallis]